MDFGYFYKAFSIKKILKYNLSVAKISRYMSSVSNLYVYIFVFLHNKELNDMFEEN